MLIDSTGMVPPGSTIVVAVSGGQDSCAMLHVLASLRDDTGLTLHAAHLNHGFRGEEGDEDAAFVGRLSASLGVECTIERADVPGMAKRLHLSAQEAARKARHEFLDRIADQIGAERIALAHTQDDHIESILLNLIRGSGIDGLRGLAPISGRRIRPLLTVMRRQTADYCHEHSIAYREDSSNRSFKYRRNRVRHELLPLLETHYNPSIRSSLLQLAEIADAESDYLDDAARTSMAGCIVAQCDESILSNRAALSALHPAILRRALRIAIGGIRGDLRDIEFRLVDGVMAALMREKRYTVDIPPGDTRVDVLSDSLEVSRVDAPRSELAFELPILLPGITKAPAMGIAIQADYVTVPEDRQFGDACAVLMDADRVALPLVVRTWRAGDRIQPMGMQGTRKLQDIFVDRKVPAGSRRRIPLIADAEGIVWVVGHTTSDRVKIVPATRNALRLVVTSAPGEQGIL